MSGLGNDKASNLTNLMYTLQIASAPDKRLRIAQRLRQHCEIESREMGSDRFTRFLEKIVKQVGEMGDVHNSKISKLGCISAVDELIEVSCHDSEKTHFWALHTYVRNLLWNSDADIDVLQPAAKALGHLARSGGGNAARILDVEVKHAFECISFETGDLSSRRLVAVLVLRELALNVPTLFVTHIQRFFQCIWTVLCDKSHMIRENAAKALRACFELLQPRGERQSEKWYNSIYKLVATTCTEKKTQPMENVHGSLLALRELLTSSGDKFMVLKFDEANTHATKFQSHKEKLIRWTYLRLLAPMAKFCPKKVLPTYVDDCVEHIDATLSGKNGGSSRSNDDRHVALETIGYLATECHKRSQGSSSNRSGSGMQQRSGMKNVLVPRLNKIILLLRKGLKGKQLSMEGRGGSGFLKRNRKDLPFCEEALRSIARLAKAVRGDLLVK